MRRASIVVLLTLVVASRAGAGGFAFDPHLSAGDFDDLAGVVADAVAFPLMTSAASSGVTGFEVLAAAGGPRVDRNASWWRYAVSGSTYGGIWPGARLIVRKGLPWRLDVGGQVGEIAGAHFLGGDARLALLEGGALSPAAALRVSYSRLQNAPMALDAKEVQLVLSKGFPIVTPYAAVGVRRVDADVTFGQAPVIHYSSRQNATTLAAGVQVRLVPFRFVGELRKGAKMGGFVGVGVGL